MLLKSKVKNRFDRKVQAAVTQISKWNDHLQKIEQTLLEL